MQHHLGGEEEEVDMQQVLVEGSKTGLHEHRGPGAREPIPMTSPRVMTPSEKAKHDLTHMPPRPGCVISRSARSPILFHPATHEQERTIPLLVGDY